MTQTTPVKTLAAGIAITALTSLGTVALAQDAFPSEPIQLVVPWGPGGPGDTYGRMLAQAINDNNLLPQPVVVVNMPGGGTTIGSRDVRDADADGYRLLFSHQTLITAELMGTSDFGPDDFTPVAETNNFCLVYGTSAESGFETMEDLQAAAEAEPGSLTDATLLGSLSHFSSAMLNDAAGIDMRYVNVGGGSARTTSLMGGHTQVAIMSPTDVIRSDGRLRALVYMGPDRHPDLPDVPTTTELGYGFESCLNYWWFAPAGTPDERLDTIRAALEQAVALPSLQEAMTSRGVTPEFYSGEALDARIAANATALSSVAGALQ